MRSGVGVIASAHVTADTTFPSIATTATQFGTSMGAQAITAPAGVTAGDLLLAFASLDQVGAAMTVSAGWTEIQQLVNTGGTDAIRLGVWGRIATGSDALTITGTAQDYCASMLRITGHGVSSVATDIKSASAHSAATPGIADPPSLDAGTSDDWLWIAAAAVDLLTSQTITAMPSGYIAAHPALASANSASSCALGVAYKAATAQTEDPGTFSHLTQDWATATLAIPPAGAGGILPSDIANLRWWLDASDAATFTYVSGTQVHTWSDKSGNGHHAVQVSGGDGTGPERTGTLNGLATVVWDGACWAIGDVSIPTDTQPNTVVIVAKVTKTTWAGVLDGGSPLTIRRQSSDGKVAFDAGTAASYTVNNTTFHIFTAIFNGASSLQRIDRTQVGTTNTGTAVFVRYKLGADYGDNKLAGEIAEAIIYDASLSAGDITAVETYLATKWGL